MKAQKGGAPVLAPAPIAQSANADAILDAAEELFAQKGFAAVTMRMIATESGQHLASANYYFGSKSGLFEAVFLRLIVPVNKRRAELLAEKAAQSVPTPQDIVDAYIRPLYENGDAERAARKARLIMLFSKQLMSNPDEHKYLQNYYEDVARVYITSIKNSMPGISMSDAIWGYNYMISILVFTLAGKSSTAKIPDDFLKSIDHAEPDEITIARLSRFVCAGLMSLSHAKA